MAVNSPKSEDDPSEKPDIKGDRLNFILLMSLYLLQAVVLGMTDICSFVLQKRKASYQDQVR